MKAFATACLIAALPGAALADSICAASKYAYDRVSTGLSLAQVEQVIGCKGEEIATSTFADVTTTMVSWRGHDLGASMNATFQNDALVGKAQFGLR